MLNPTRDKKGKHVTKGRREETSLKTTALSKRSLKVKTGSVTIKYIYCILRGLELLLDCE